MLQNQFLISASMAKASSSLPNSSRNLAPSSMLSRTSVLVDTSRTDVLFGPSGGLVKRHDLLGKLPVTPLAERHLRVEEAVPAEQRRGSRVDGGCQRGCGTSRTSGPYLFSPFSRSLSSSASLTRK
jgi:hypothetical protein